MMTVILVVHVLKSRISTRKSEREGAVTLTYNGVVFSMTAGICRIFLSFPMSSNNT